MIDIGANLSNEQFSKDLEKVLISAKENNIEFIILTTTSEKSFFENIKIIEKYGSIINLKTTYGLHPHNAKDYKNFFINYDKNMLNENIISVGEFGLDYFRMISSKQEQINVVEIFLEKAKYNKSLPLFLHERQSFEDFYNLLKNNLVNNKKIIHSFTGNKEQLKKYLELDCYFSINGWITDDKRNTDLLDAIKYMPIDRLMLETDCPYLSPKNLHKKIYRNEPKYLKNIAQYISEIKKINFIDLINITNKNSVEIFNLKNENKLKL